MGICLPYKKATQFRLKLKIADFEQISEKPKQADKVGYNRWSWRLNRTPFKSHFNSLATMDRVYIYLIDEKGEHVCYWKGKAADFSNKNPEYQWISMKADRSIGKVKEDYEAGQI